VKEVVTVESLPERVPASGELIALAAQAVRDFKGDCFWFRHPEARIRYRNDIQVIIRHLREYGGWKAWRRAQEIQKCL
jgi:hypothetical protein